MRGFWAEIEGTFPKTKGEEKDSASGTQLSGRVGVTFRLTSGLMRQITTRERDKQKLQHYKTI